MQHARLTPGASKGVGGTGNSFCSYVLKRLHVYHERCTFTQCFLLICNGQSNYKAGYRICSIYGPCMYHYHHLEVSSLVVTDQAVC